MMRKKFFVIMTFVFGLIATLIPGDGFAADGNKKYGFIDKTGKIVIEPKYDQVKSFSEGLAAVWTGGKWGYINTEGKIIIPSQYDWVSAFDKGKAIVGVYDKDDKYGQAGLRLGSIDKEGKVIDSLSYNFEEITDIVSKETTTFINKSSQKWGYKDKNNAIIVKPQFDEAYPFSEGLALVRLDDKYGYIDETGKMVINPQYQIPDEGDFGAVFSTFKEGSAIVCNDEGKYGVINKNGDIVVKFLFDYISPYSEGLAVIRVNGKEGDLYGEKWGFIDNKGKVVIKPQFDLVEDFSEGLASFQDKGQWGFIDQDGKIIIPAKFSYVQPFKDDLTSVEQFGRWGVIDKNGKVVIDFKFDFISEFSEGLAYFGPKPRW